MTPADHRAQAVDLVEELERFAIETSERLALAQLHATLALAPPPPPPVQPQHRWSLDKPHSFPDATGGQVTVLPVKGAPGVVLTIGEGAALLENPDILRTLASLLTAHANRLESKP